MTPDQYCQNQTRNSHSSFYLSFLFLPPDKRRAINALYAFCREVDDVVDECTDSKTARTRLAWWRDEIAQLFQGHPHHPISRALEKAVHRFDLPEEHFMEIIDGMEMDLENNRYETFQELTLYCYRVAAVVGLMVAEIFGYRERATRKYAHDLGMAFQLTNIIRDVGEDARRGRIYLPRAEMARFGVNEGDLGARRTSEALQRLLQFHAERAHHYYQSAFAQLPDSDRDSQLSGLIMAAIYQATLKALEQDAFPVLERHVKLPLWKKIHLTLQTFYREKIRRRKAAKRLETN